MNVTIDVSPAVHGRAGLGRYASELVEALHGLQDGAVRLRIFYTEAQSASPQGVLATLPRFTSNLGYKPWRLAAMASHFSRVPFDSFYGRPEIVHATDHLLPHVRTRAVFTLHDLIFEIHPEHHKLYNHTFLKLMMRRFLRAADHIISVSEHSKRDAVRLYDIAPEKITVVYNGVDERFQPEEEAERLAAVVQRYELPERFLLHVGTIEPRKNLGMLLDVLAVLKPEFPELQLVLAGKKGWLYEPFFAKLAASGLEPDVRLVGHVLEEDLPVLYSLASVFVFPSVYEGFGLPALEALACGAPVVASNSSSLPEVVGDAGILVAPTDVTGWVAALRRVLTEPGLQRDLRSRGPEWVKQFSWKRNAQETLGVYKQLLDGSGPL